MPSYIGKDRVDEHTLYDPGFPMLYCLLAGLQLVLAHPLALTLAQSSLNPFAPPLFDYMTLPCLLLPLHLLPLFLCQLIITRNRVMATRQFCAQTTWTQLTTRTTMANLHLIVSIQAGTSNTITSTMRSSDIGSLPTKTRRRCPLTAAPTLYHVPMSQPSVLCNGTSTA